MIQSEAEYAEVAKSGLAADEKLMAPCDRLSLETALRERHRPAIQIIHGVYPRSFFGTIEFALPRGFHEPDDACCQAVDDFLLL
jgi:hypothetical protein